MSINIYIPWIMDYFVSAWEKIGCGPLMRPELKWIVSVIYQSTEYSDAMHRQVVDNRQHDVHGDYAQRVVRM